MEKICSFFKLVVIIKFSFLGFKFTKSKDKSHGNKIGLNKFILKTIDHGLIYTDKDI